MEKYFDVLKKCPLFKNIEGDKLKDFIICLNAKAEKFAKKHTVIAEGAPAEYIGVVLSGSVQVIQIDYLGNRSILSVAKTSDIFCVAFACAEAKSIPITVVAAEPSEVMLINRNRVMYTCSNTCGCHKQMLLNLIRELANKNIAFQQKLEVVSKRSTREKLMTYLTLQSKKTDSQTVTIPFNRQELADYLEVDRSGLSAEISKLRKENILIAEKNRFTLL